MLMFLANIKLLQLKSRTVSTATEISNFEMSLSQDASSDSLDGASNDSGGECLYWAMQTLGF